jgi:hypothetical protein
MYHAGSLDEGGLYHAIRDDGYSDGDTQKLVSNEKLKHSRTLANLAGTWTIRSIVRGYQSGTLDGLAADRLLAPLVPDGQQRGTILRDADDKVRVDTKIRKIGKIRRGFFVGFYNTPTTDGLLAALGVSEQRRGDLIDQWTADRDGRFREPTVKIILDWIKAHIISPDDAYTRFINLGYVAPDAARMAATGAKALADQATAADKQAQAKSDKLIKSNLAMQRETDKAQLARMKEIDAQILKLQKEKDKVDKWNADRQAKVNKVSKKK